MTAIKISAFGGMIPAQDDRLLPENNAAFSRNCCFDSGALQGMHMTRNVHTLDNPDANFVFRIPLLSPDKDHIMSSFWMEFTDPDTNVIRNPIANDSFDRYYYTSPTVSPRYNTLARIKNGDPDYILGIPGPSVAPGVSPTGGTGLAEARAYVYTWVSTYGEEGPPSPPTLITGKVDDTWNISMTAPTGSDTTDRSLATTRIYRTITSAAGTATFYFVAEISIATLSYADTIPDTTASAANTLASSIYTGPPSDLLGWVSMPNGMVAGWRANEVWFCEPYLLHAWPAAYTLSFDYDVVGLGVIGQTLMVLTEGFPYAVSGVTPSTMASASIASYEPCMARASIVSTPLGVLYASPNGLALAAAGTVQNATVNLATKDKWQQLLRLETLRAARLGQYYYCWGSIAGDSVFEITAFETTAFEQQDFTGSYSGAFISLTDQRTAWSFLYNAFPTGNVITDIWSGEVFIIRDATVYWIDFSSPTFDEPFLWRSKVFQTLEYKNLAALRVMFDPGDVVQNPVRNVDPTQELQPDQYGIIRAYANGTLVMTREIRTSGEVMRLPSGFKAAYWQFELEANVVIYSLEIGASVKELQGV